MDVFFPADKNYTLKQSLDILFSKYGLARQEKLNIYDANYPYNALSQDNPTLKQIGIEKNVLSILTISGSLLTTIQSIDFVSEYFNDNIIVHYGISQAIFGVSNIYTNFATNVLFPFALTMLYTILFANHNNLYCDFLGLHNKTNLFFTTEDELNLLKIHEADKYSGYELIALVHAFDSHENNVEAQKTDIISFINHNYYQYFHDDMVLDKISNLIPESELQA
jgi:hypothetical protein